MEKTNKFVAIDFEYLYQNRYDTPCSVGLVKVINGVVVSKCYTLIYQPLLDAQLAPNNSITPEMAAEAPTYGKVYAQMVDFIDGLPLLAHNAGTERKILEETPYPINLPRLADMPFIDTCTATGQRGLAELCDEYSIPLDHHNALSDAEATAVLYVKLCGEEMVKEEVRKVQPAGKYAAMATEDSKEKDSFGSLPESEWATKDSPLRDKHVCVSGEYQFFPDRGDLRRELMKLGAIVDKSIVKATEILVCGSIKDAGPSKKKQIIERGGMLLSEQEVLMLLQGK
jgi:DNA polymerase-3 subunit epsilon